MPRCHFQAELPLASGLQMSIHVCKFNKRSVNCLTCTFKTEENNIVLLSPHDVNKLTENHNTPVGTRLDDLSPSPDQLAQLHLDYSLLFVKRLQSLANEARKLVCPPISKFPSELGLRFHGNLAMPHMSRWAECYVALNDAHLCYFWENPDVPHRSRLL